MVFYKKEEFFLAAALMQKFNFKAIACAFIGTLLVLAVALAVAKI